MDRAPGLPGTNRDHDYAAAATDPAANAALWADLLNRDLITEVTARLRPADDPLLHLLAMAHTIGVELTLDDFTRLGANTPLLADLRPSGRFLMSELIKIGGIQPLMKMMLDRGMLHGDCLTVTGKTLAENLKDVQPYPAGQEIIQSFDKPIKKDSHLVILRGNIAPQGAVAKLTGKEGLEFTGTARVFNSEEESLKGILDGSIGPAEALARLLGREPRPE